MKHFPVQIMGGIALHRGSIAEMQTGEGKTLVATLPAYLNALTGNGVHIVTVNDYLAKRDSEWMGKVHRFMGLTVGLIVHDLTKEQRQAAYAADITYGTNNEMGFDYLRDNMAIYKDEQVQRGHSFAIVDEVDSILIDEARTPLIISGMGEKSTQLYDMAESFACRLKKYVVTETDDKEAEDETLDADYIVDEKARTATLTARGIAKAEEFFHLDNLSDPENSTIAHHINQAIKAHGTMKRDVDYVVKDGEIIIVDEFTGRLMFGRRYSEGLHQAIEAKEHVSVQRESKTLATITFQNYFRLYSKLSGMTGTAMTEEEEFATIYKLDIVEIPTNRPVVRIDNEDAVYKTEQGKYRAVIRQVKECHEKGQPVLVGTVSIEKNELLSRMLTKEGIKHNLLNAKNHEKEAEIVAQAGQFGAVTVATNMAGRGTDIMLGGNAEYMATNDLRKAGYTDEVIADGSRAYTLGPLIHNPQVVADLAARGAEAVGSVEDICWEGAAAGDASAEGSASAAGDVPAVVIRSHGVTPQVLAAVEDRGFSVVDATCPHVSRAQHAAAELAAEGCRVIVVGEAGHPEVEGLTAWAEEAGGKVDVVAAPEEIPEGLYDPVGVVAQTTQRRENLEAVVAALREAGLEPIVKNTICSATRQRQEAAADLASAVDAMVVIGGRNSSNTTRLAEVCALTCPRTFHIESTDELDPEAFADCRRVGVTAGASTPENQIAAVEAFLRAL